MSEEIEIEIKDEGPKFMFVMKDDKQNMIESIPLSHVFWTTKKSEALTFTESEKESLVETLKFNHPQWAQKVIIVLL